MEESNDLENQHRVSKMNEMKSQGGGKMNIGDKGRGGATSKTMLFFVCLVFLAWSV